MSCFPLLEQFPPRELHLNKGHKAMDILWDLEVLLKPKAWRVNYFSVGGDMNICTGLVSGALGWKFLSLAPAINFSSADIMGYSCTGRNLPTTPFSGYSHVHLGTAGLPNVSFMTLLETIVQLYRFWFLLGNSGWHLIQLESVLPVSWKNDKREWRLPTVIQGNTWHLLLFIVQFLFGTCMPIGFCKMLMFCLLEQFGTDVPCCIWPLNLLV